ncbi:hypothetical protein EC843_102161 [Buttiauxella sp. JUb87]|uniref:hypothetical protein n=1 Tax=Buttiauxella sp. JUb87 TaxID=2485129 RepID=UPI001060773E|nr:hypothetical protein [Buttiauxella sp. JUb87]TDN52729.1 hypothetical protein EC843_102161 [Buttiauxella sp. JUb87]
MRKILRVVGAFKPLANNVVIRFIVGFPVTIGTLQLSEYFYKNNFIFLYKSTFTLAVYLFYQLIFLSLIMGMTGRIYTFHETKNSANINKNPLKFAIKHRDKIVMFYKLFFIVGSAYALIMLWFFE